MILCINYHCKSKKQCKRYDRKNIKNYNNIDHDYVYNEYPYVDKCEQFWDKESESK